MTFQTIFPKRSIVTAGTFQMGRKPTFFAVFKQMMVVLVSFVAFNAFETKARINW